MRGAYRADDRVVHIGHYDSIAKIVCHRVGKGRPHGVTKHIRGETKNAFEADECRGEGLKQHGAHWIPTLHIQ